MMQSRAAVRAIVARGVTNSIVARASRVRACSLGGCRQFSNVPAEDNGAQANGWAPHDQKELGKMARQSLLLELSMKQQSRYSDIVDWFLTNLPNTYFRQITEETRMEHLQAITTLANPSFFDAAPEGAAEKSKVPFRDMNLHFERKIPGGHEVTFIQPGGLCLAMIADLPPADGTLRNVKVFMSRDGNLAINVFTYQREKDARLMDVDTMEGERAVQNLEQYRERLQQGEFKGEANHPQPAPYFEKAALREYLAKCEPGYVMRSHPRRFLKQMELYQKVSGSEGVVVDVEQYDGQDVDVGTTGDLVDGQAHSCHPVWITACLANVLPKMALQQAMFLLPAKNLNVIRCHLDVVADPGNGTVTHLRMLVVPSDKSTEDNWGKMEFWEAMMKDLKRLKWLDNRVMDLAFNVQPTMGLERAEIAYTLSRMVYGRLHKRNPWAFTSSQLDEWLDSPRHLKHSMAIADLFMKRFDPADPMPFEDVKKEAVRIRAQLKSNVECESAQTFFEELLAGVLAAQRTNLYMPERYALALRVHPTAIMTDEEVKTKEVPYGVFFMQGRRFVAFHCRFRDIARGGLRLVTPATMEQVAIEGARAFDEAYNLSFAQQMKNKDIPEGGAKAVVLVNNTNASAKGKQHAMRKTVKAFTDSMLDLTVDTPETRAHVIDFFGKQELIYLGPDEQVVPEDINWIVARAKRRSYPIPAAFMSSKPDLGINHKEFGVTSEGVFVFLDEALKARGIDPRKQSFTVKLTGGPDGDVAGNMVKIMVREYGENVKIVGMADGFGCLEDPDGLAHAELIRLFKAGLPTASFDKKALGPRGELHLCNNETGIRARNTMHNRVKADAFVTAGGRPSTISVLNYKDFQLPDGSPSSPLVVEGANLFITPEARKLLSTEMGVLIVKDSSANKCGVICSSFEIISSMLMDADEFKANKPAIVADVLQKLRHIAWREAKLLFRLSENYPGTLPSFSEGISNSINRVTDALLTAIDAAAEKDDPTEYNEYKQLIMPLVREHLPNKLAEIAFDRIPTRMPEQYLRNAMASCLASHICYNEGVPFINAQPDDRLVNFCLSYIRREKDVMQLMDAVNKQEPLNPADKSKILDILKAGGVRSVMEVY